MKQPVAGASRTNCKRSASQINKVQPPSLTVHANTWLISLFSLWHSGAFYPHLWILPGLVSHQKYPCVRFSTGALRAGGLKEELKQVQGFAKVRGEKRSTEPNPASAAPISSCSAAMGWRKTSVMSDHSSAHTRCHGGQALFTCNCLSEGKLGVSTMDSSCCLHGSMKSTKVPTTAPVAHSVRISNTARDMALEHLLKYLPELWLRLPQNLRRTENCLRGGTWEQRGHFSEYGLTGWKTKPHFTVTHPHEGSCKAWRFPASAHP